MTSWQNNGLGATISYWAAGIAFTISFILMISAKIDDFGGYIFGSLICLIISLVVFVVVQSGFIFLILLILLLALIAMIISGLS